MPTTIKERPILFSAPMVRAIRAGKKTQTRRVVNLKHALSADKKKIGWKICSDPSLFRRTYLVKGVQAIRRLAAAIESLIQR